MGLFSKMTAKAVSKKTGGFEKKYLLVCPNCGEKMVVRIELEGVSLGGKATYKVVNNATGDVVAQTSFDQKYMQKSGQGIFNTLMNGVECPKCGISMTSSTTF